MDKRLAQWFASGDTGTSSKCVATFLSAGVGDGSSPMDMNDWARCMRLLDIMPEWKSRMTEMAGAGGGWAPLAKRWSELADTWQAETGTTSPPKYEWPDCPKSVALFKEIRAAADAASGVVWVDLGGARMTVSAGLR